MELGSESTDKQIDRGTLRHCLLYIQRALATNREEGRLGVEGTDNQTDRRLTQWALV